MIITHFLTQNQIRSRCDFHTTLKKPISETSKNVVGPAIRRLRMSQKTAVSQQDLSGRLAARGIILDRSAIARIENGERYVRDYEALAIARLFNVPIEKIFG